MPPSHAAYRPTNATTHGDCSRVGGGNNHGRVENMAPWDNNRPTRVPPHLRTLILTRDGHQCTATLTDGTRCTETTRLEIDHADRHGPTAPDNLRTLCHWHHNRKTQGEAAQARRSAVRTVRHPGLTG